MSNENEPEAIALTFREAIEDLQGFARNEINTLTMIARENTEHAHAISGALQEHIKRVGSISILDMMASIGYHYFATLLLLKMASV